MRKDYPLTGRYKGIGYRAHPSPTRFSRRQERGLIDMLYAMGCKRFKGWQRSDSGDLPTHAWPGWSHPDKGWLGLDAYDAAFMLVALEIQAA